MFYFLFFPTCPYLYICNSCIFVYVCVYVCVYMYMCIYVCMYCDGRSTRQTQWVWRQASERLLLNRNNTIKVSKGNKVSKIKGGIWCPRCAARVVKEGQCSGRKGPGKGAESGGRTRSPPRSGARGTAAFPAASSTSRSTATLDGSSRPGILARRPSRGCGPRPDRGSGSSRLRRHPIPQRSLPGPTRTPACMHGEETGLQRRGATGIYSGGDEAPFTSGVCLITRRQTWLLQRPSSLTHPLPSGAWWRAAIKGTGECW